MALLLYGLGAILTGGGLGLMWAYRKTDTAEEEIEHTWLVAIGALLMIGGLVSLASS